MLDLKRVTSALSNKLLLLGLTQNRKRILRTASSALDLNTGKDLMKIVKNISSFISLPCSLIYGVFSHRMLPSWNVSSNE